MTNKEIMADSLRLFKAFREALGKARLELKKKALFETVHDTASKTIDKFYDHDRDLESVGFSMSDIQRLGKVSDDGNFWFDYNEKGERKR